MIDVIEVRYELVKVKQQKYVCRCDGCVETAIGPARALPGSRYSLAFAIKVRGGVNVPIFERPALDSRVPGGAKLRSRNQVEMVPAP